MAPDVRKRRFAPIKTIAQIEQDRRHAIDPGSCGRRIFEKVVVWIVVLPGVVSQHLQGFGVSHGDLGQLGHTVTDCGEGRFVVCQPRGGACSNIVVTSKVARTVSDRRRGHLGTSKLNDGIAFRRGEKMVDDEDTRPWGNRDGGHGQVEARVREMKGLAMSPLHSVVEEKLVLSHSVDLVRSGCALAHWISVRVHEHLDLAPNHL
mmetsp:Transcript_41132/g.88923  ORF Transcript_41132/g.88923 Transcript_41132/m.88923 type:complete len:205 (+) Transcript_41132:814-1428(+)